MHKNHQTSGYIWAVVFLLSFFLFQGGANVGLRTVLAEVSSEAPGNPVDRGIHCHRDLMDSMILMKHWCTQLMSIDVNFSNLKCIQMAKVSPHFCAPNENPPVDWQAENHSICCPIEATDWPRISIEVEILTIEKKNTFTPGKFKIIMTGMSAEKCNWGWIGQASNMGE